MRKISNRSICLILGAVVAMLMGVFLLSQHHRVPDYRIPTAHIPKIDGLVLPQPRIIRDFVLTRDTGKTFNKASMQGHWTLMFFGFSNCGYVCPTTLAALNKVVLQLQTQLPVPQQPQVVMVSVDPDRDTVPRLHDYVTRFNPHFIGARGTPDETAVLAQQMSVVFTKVQTSPKPKNNYKDNYMINHSAEIMLLNPNGDLQAFFSYPPDPLRIAREYITILKAFPLNRAVLADSKWTVINYWAKWCGPCATETKALKQFAAQYPDQVKVFAVNYDDVTPLKLKQLAQRGNISYRLLEDLNKNINVVPTTIILNPQGHVAQVLQGPQTFESLQKLTGMKK